MPKPVLLIRGERNDTDAAALADLGIETHIDPYIRVERSKDPRGAERLLQALQSPSENPWLIVTSANAVRFWIEAIGRQVLVDAISQNPGLQFAAVGEQSAEALRELGAKNVHTPEEQTAAGLAALLVLLPRGHAIVPVGNLAMKSLATELAAAGWRIDTDVVYDTEPIEERPPSADLVASGAFAAVLLRSPSAVRAFLHHVPAPVIPLISTGPTTSRAIEDRRMVASATSSSPSPEAVAETIREFLNRR
jgi:uroporphyrinogen-III synthase